jgi:hypothetical protein
MVLLLVAFHATARPRFLEGVVNLGGTTPRPIHASLNSDQLSIPTTCIFLASVFSNSNGLTRADSPARSLLPEYTANMSGFGFALGENMIRLRTLVLHSSAILYSCHSGHHRLLGLLRASSLMCFANNSTVYIVHATLGDVLTCVHVTRTKYHLGMNVLSAAYLMKNSLLMLS